MICAVVSLRWPGIHVEFEDRDGADRPEVGQKFVDFACDANGCPIEWIDVVSLSEVGRVQRSLGAGPWAALPVF